MQFRAPHDNSLMLLTPEHSMEIQNVIGADIIMQLDDVVHSLTMGPRVEEAMWRTLRWLDRSGEKESSVGRRKEEEREKVVSALIRYVSKFIFFWIYCVYI